MGSLHSDNTGCTRHMEVWLRNDVVPFHLETRLQEQTPGGYLQGTIILPVSWQPKSRSNLLLSCAQSREHEREEIPGDGEHPCRIHVFYFNRGKRVKNIDSDGGNIFADLDVVDIPRKLEILDKDVLDPESRKVVARVKWIQGRPGILLGVKDGDLR